MLSQAKMWMFDTLTTINHHIIKTSILIIKLSPDGRKSWLSSQKTMGYTDVPTEYVRDRQNEKERAWNILFSPPQKVAFVWRLWHTLTTMVKAKLALVAKGRLGFCRFDSSQVPEPTCLVVFHVRVERWGLRVPPGPSKAGIIAEAGGMQNMFFQQWHIVHCIS